MRRLWSDYGMIVALLALCALLSWWTWDEQQPTGGAAARQVLRSLACEGGRALRVLVVARAGDGDREFGAVFREGAATAGLQVLEVVCGTPVEARLALNRVVEAGERLDLIVCTQATRDWPVFDRLAERLPSLAGARFVVPANYHWPNFLKADNLLNVANQIVVIAILAIGMTLVIITGGIDLSVGSLVALSAVVATLLIQGGAGAEQAGPLALVVCSLAGIAVGGLMGFFSGAMITLFAIPPFIVTLAMMLVGSGLAYLLARGESVYRIPESYVWLGRGTLGGGIPVSVLLMLILYAVAHLVMGRTVLGRYVYAVGGNREAARLSGVPVNRVLLFVYSLGGALAGLGGVVTASQLRSGSPNYGLMYELYVIAAVVVGGTSLSGGEGKVLGTLIGVLIIAVIQNGMNLTGVESYTQKVVLGLVILGAVLLDTIKRRGWRVLPRQS